MKNSAALKRGKGLAKIKQQTQTASEIKDLIVKILDDGKAQDVTALSLKGKTTIADYLVIASGTSERHLLALAQRICEELGKVGIKGLQVEGEGGSEWLLVDVNDVIVHLFKPDRRKFYDLETMWSGDFERLLSQIKTNKTGS